MKVARRYPIGVEVLADGTVDCRVWAPRCASVELIVEGGLARVGNYVTALTRESGGYFWGQVAALGPGALYRFRLDGGSTLFADPMSRFQPEGPHGPSQVIDCRAFKWTDGTWRGTALAGQVIYELHIGTFTAEGTWAAAGRELPELAELGITVIEVMPVSEFPGRFGWGYDGVNLFAPTRLYGEPDDFRRFVDQAHSLGLGVILDVVYNHIGPDGNYLPQFSADYFTDRYANDWGQALNFDGENCAPVREYFLANAAYWIEEFHLDGLRLDATQAIQDNSPEHILATLARRVRAAAGKRQTLLVAENEPQLAKLVRAPDRGGYGLDALWNDDFHHCAVVALTGRKGAYYTDYLGTAQELVSAAKWGFLFQGQHYKWQGKRRGSSALDLAPAAFITFIENHDQVANSACGRRLHQMCSPARHRAMSALLLLMPGTPMLFQGQEFGSSSPFLFFADHQADLARCVFKGRIEFLKQFPNFAVPEVEALISDPAALDTFERCKLDLSERESHKEVYDLHKDLLRLRRDDPVFRAQRPHGIDGAVLAEQAFVLRYFADDGQDRLLVVNLGRDLHLDPAPEPLLAPPADCEWAELWSSENPRYGGVGNPPLDGADNWHIPGEAAVVLMPGARLE